MIDPNITNIDIDVPNKSGQLCFEFNIRPVSLGAERSKKDVVTDAIRKVTKQINYLFSNDVSIEIVWHINEDERYESDAAADVDNILKPILDALSGPDGILIDDCQVQHISSHWVSRYYADEKIEITIKYEPDIYALKKDLIFIQLIKPLCIPFRSNLPKDLSIQILNNIQSSLNLRNNFMANGIDYYDAKMVMPIQRLFHKTRLNGFNIIDIDKFKESLN